MILITTFLVVALGFISGAEEAGIAIALVLAVFLIQRQYNQKITALARQLEQVSQAKPAQQGQQTGIVADPVSSEQTSEISNQIEKPASVSQSVDELDSEFPELEETNWSDNAVKNRWQPNAIERLLKQATQYAISWFTDGNIFVRVGLLVLFVGVAFLLKYAADNSRIPIEVRFLGAAMGGLALIIFGWRLRLMKTIFALLLQGGGIGIIYITIFASFRIAHLIPSSLTFVLLVMFALITAALAVLQNSRSLAMYAVLGGFIAPFLASSGSGNYVGLFNYYAVLNLIVFAIAWFKAWRVLNLMGFAFTFGVYAFWFTFSYRPEMLIPAAMFLLLFFMLYSVLGILYALKQTQDLRGLVDGTLVFGTPLISSSVAMVMLRHMDYGIALCSLALGLYYVLMARFLWQRIGDQTRLLAEAMLAIGVIFATLAIPYALDGHWSSATWALEATGILWVSLRQNRRYAQVFALLLQLGAGVLFLLRNADDVGQSVWMNPSFLGGVFIALGAVISSRLLVQLPDREWIKPIHWFFYIWGMGWWLLSTLIQIDHYLSYQMFAILMLLVITSALLFYVDRIREWNWRPASIQLALMLPVLILLAAVGIADKHHLLIWPDLIGWFIALALCYVILFKLESLKWQHNIYLLSCTGLVVLISVMFSIELYWRFDHFAPNAGESYTALLTVFPLLAMWWARQGKSDLLIRWGQPLQLMLSASLVLVLALWSLVNNFGNDGSAVPLPFVPFFNPLDLAHIMLFLSITRSLGLLQNDKNEYRYAVLALVGGLGFIWISALFLRAMHHYNDVPFHLNMMLSNASVQTGLSILWTLIGMITILVASRRSLRTLWIVGAVLVGVVIVKLIFADLRAIGTVERIVSFLVVGGLLVALGYFSPIPPKSKLSEKEIVDHG